MHAAMVFWLLREDRSFVATKWRLWCAGVPGFDEFARAHLKKTVETALSRAKQALAEYEAEKPDSPIEVVQWKRLPWPHSQLRRHIGHAHIAKLERVLNAIDVGDREAIQTLSPSDLEHLGKGARILGPGKVEAKQSPIKSIVPRNARPARLGRAEWDRVVEHISPLLQALDLHHVIRVVERLPAPELYSRRDEVQTILEALAGEPVLVSPTVLGAYLGLAHGPEVVWTRLRDLLMQLVQEGKLPPPRPPVLIRILQELSHGPGSH
jgi:hypothetical protein